MDRLAELRERRALTLRELAEMSGVAADTINQIELGHRKARPSTLRKLARALEVDVRALFEEPVLTGKEPAPPSPLPAEDTEERRRFSPETWPHLRTMLISWSGTVESVSQDHGPLIQKLPNQPTGVEFTRAAPWLRTLLRTIDTINKALMNSGVAATTNELWAALKDGEPIPTDLEQKVRRLYQAIETLNAEVEPEAREWLERYSETEQVNEIDELIPRWESEMRQAAARRTGPEDAG